MGSGPLQGIRVLEFSQIVAGPVAQGPTVTLATYRLLAAVVLLGGAAVGLVGTSALATVPLAGAVLLLASRYRELVD